MAKIELATIAEPLGDEQPCGPDLDMEFDLDFMNFVAEIDGTIPTRYFGWDPAALDFQKYYDLIGEFLQRTRDIRILVPLAKLRILQSDIAGFAETLEAIHTLLRERWNDVHPQPAEFLDLSMGQLSTLDDMPNVVLPLQHATLVRSRRAGAITFRKWQLANGEVTPREGEETIDGDALRSGLGEAEPDELIRVRDTLVRAREAISGIRKICIEEAGFDHAPTFERLPPTLDAMIAMIESVTGGGAEDADETGIPAEAEGAGGMVVVRLPAGAVSSREEAVEAMHVAARYFALKEPSSPVPILLREAQSAATKSFYELVNDMLPDHASTSFVSLGRDTWFDIYLSTLDARNPAPDYAAEDEASAAAEDTGLGDDEEAADQLPDGSGNDWPAEESDAAAAGEESGEPGDDSGEPAAGERSAEQAEAEDTATAEDEPAEESTAAEDEAAETDPGADTEPEPEPQPEPEPEVVPQPAPTGPKFVANSRPEAVALLEKVLAYYRVAEPTSPVPLLVERAVEFSSKSFIEILGKVLPAGSLNARSDE